MICCLAWPYCGRHRHGGGGRDLGKGFGRREAVVCEEETITKGVGQDQQGCSAIMGRTGAWLPCDLWVFSPLLRVLTAFTRVVCTACLINP